jgi:hypothetical protein
LCFDKGIHNELIVSSSGRGGNNFFVQSFNPLADGHLRGENGAGAFPQLIAMFRDMPQ